MYVDNYADTRYCMTGDKKAWLPPCFFVGEVMNRVFGDYQLREAAGCYWLIDMRQSGKTWKQPLRLNETGAFLLQGVYEGKTREELAAALAAHYEMSAEELQEDVDLFLAQLAAHQVTFV